MSGYSYTVLRDYQRRADAMLADPDMTRHLLALGLSLLDTVVLRRWQDDETGGDRVRLIATRAFGPARPVDTLRYTIREDARRYSPLADAGSQGDGCTAPMIRRAGLCGKPGGRSHLHRDPDTGRCRWVTACSRHVDWWAAEVRRLEAHRRAVLAKQTEPARPAANTGGVLRRHLPELDWPQLWSWADPSWVEAPEEATPAFTRPTLRLIVGGVDGD